MAWIISTGLAGLIGLALLGVGIMMRRSTNPKDKERYAIPFFWVQVRFFFSGWSSPGSLPFLRLVLVTLA